jgi:hypothetical protein
MSLPQAVLTDASGARVALTIRGYQYARAVDVDDANWLRVSLAASDGQRGWEADEPTLLTWEVARLIAWLRAIAAGEEHEPSIDFIEPELALEVDGSGDEAIVTLTLAYGFRPPWVPLFEAARLRVRPGAAGLRDCADALAAALARFPERASGDSGPE